MRSRWYERCSTRCCEDHRVKNVHSPRHANPEPGVQELPRSPELEPQHQGHGLIGQHGRAEIDTGAVLQRRQDQVECWHGGTLSPSSGGRHTPQNNPRPAPGRPGRNTGWQGGRRQGGCGWGHCRGACCPEPHPPIRCPRQRPHWWRCGGSCGGVPRRLQLRPDAVPVARPHRTPRQRTARLALQD